MSSKCSERQMNMEIDSTVQKFKFKQWQQKVIADARITDRCTTAACNFEDSTRMKRLMENSRNYKLMTLEDLELICLNRGCRSLPCAKHYQPQNVIIDTGIQKAPVLHPSFDVAVIEGCSKSNDGVPIEGSKKSRGGVAACGILFQKIDKFYCRHVNQEEKVVHGNIKNQSKISNSPRPYHKSAIFSFPWKKVLLGRSAKAKKKKSSTHYKMVASSSRPTLDPINPKLVENIKLQFRFKPRAKSKHAEPKFKLSQDSLLGSASCSTMTGQTSPHTRTINKPSALDESVCKKNEKLLVDNIARRKSGWKVPAPGGLRGGHPGSPTRSFPSMRAMEQLDYHAETEIGHALTPTEKSLLFGRFSLELVLSRIRQVG